MKPKPPLTLVSAQRRLRNNDHCAAFCGEAVVVVRFAVMNEHADAFAFGMAVVQIRADFVPE